MEQQAGCQWHKPSRDGHRNGQANHFFRPSAAELLLHRTLHPLRIHLLRMSRNHWNHPELQRERLPPLHLPCPQVSTYPLRQHRRCPRHHCPWEHLRGQALLRLLPTVELLGPYSTSLQGATPATIIIIANHRCYDPFFLRVQIFVASKNLFW